MLDYCAPPRSGHQPRSSNVAVHSLLHQVLFAKSISKIKVGVGVVRLEAEGSAVVPHCLVRLADLAERVSQAIVCVGKVWLELEGMLEATNRALHVPFIVKAGGEICLRDGKVRAQVQRLFECLSRLLEAVGALILEGRAVVRVGVGKLRCEPDGLFIVSLCSLQITLVLENAREVAPCNCVVGLDPDRLKEAALRLFELSCALKRLPKLLCASMSSGDRMSAIWYVSCALLVCPRCM